MERFSRALRARLLFVVLGSAALLLPGSAVSQQIAFTFDDLPAHGDLPPGQTRLGVIQSLVKTLQAEHMPPTYGFINASGVASKPDELNALKAWTNGGQLLGNHTWAHPDINKVTAAEFDHQIQQDEPMLQQLQPNADWHWFRFPFLHEGDTAAKRKTVRTYLESNGYHLAEVDMDFEDYRWNDPYARCMVKHDDAAVKRLHDTYLAEAAHYATYFRAMSQEVYKRDVKYILLMHVGAFDARMLPELIALYRSKGFTFTTLADASSDPANQNIPRVGDPSGGTVMEGTLALRNLHYPNDSPQPDKMLDAVCK